MTYNPGTWTCDRCSHPISEREMVAFDIKAGEDEKWRGGWMAHYHVECWQDVRDALKAVIDEHRSEVSHLERIPTASYAEIRGRPAEAAASAAWRDTCDRSEAWRNTCDRSEAPGGIRHLYPGRPPTPYWLLLRAGIATIEELTAVMADGRIMMVQGIGPARRDDLRDALEMWAQLTIPDVIS